MHSDDWFRNDSFQIERIEAASHALNQALQSLCERDYASARNLVTFTKQVLEELLLDCEHHVQAEALLNQFRYYEQSIN